MVQVIDAAGINQIAPIAVPDASPADARRARAHARASRHSARVRTLRRVIPMLVGASVLVLGAVVLLNPFGRLPGIGVGPVSLSGSKVRMENPRLSGFRKDSRGYEVTADAALQDLRRPSVIELQAMRGQLATDDHGGLARLQAAIGVFDTTREALDLERDIRIWTDKGEEAVLRSAAVDFKAGTVKSRETVTVTIPTGSVVADGLDVVDNGRVISFIGNVHALFRQGEKGEGNKDAGGKDSGSKGDAPTREPGLRVLTSSAEPAGDRP